MYIYIYICNQASGASVQYWQDTGCVCLLLLIAIIINASTDSTERRRGGDRKKCQNK